MSLKEQITRTENLETKLKKGITNINNVIVRGGGAQSTSVAEVPDNITKMLGQYKKIAMGKWTGRYTRTRAQFIDQGVLIQGQSNDLYSWWKLPKNLRIEIPLNLNFTPSLIFMTFDQLSPGTGFKTEQIKYQMNTRDHYCYNDVDIQNKKKATTVASTSSYLEAFVEEISKEKIILNMYVQKNLFNQGAGTNVYTQNCQWVAIE